MLIWEESQRSVKPTILLFQILISVYGRLKIDSQNK
jgi:hypothetical protein